MLGTRIPSGIPNLSAPVVLLRGMKSTSPESRQVPAAIMRGVETSDAPMVIPAREIRAGDLLAPWGRGERAERNREHGGFSVSGEGGDGVPFSIHFARPSRRVRVTRP